MKKIQLLIATLLMSIMPMLFTSCDEPTPEPTPEVTIVGTWECINAILKQETDPTGGESGSEKGSIWEFDKEKLTVGGKTYDYTLSDHTLTTSYAEMYQSNSFNVDSLSLNDLILSTSYVEETKVGNVDVTVTLSFKRQNK
mgnify:CR=1 FL=1